MFGPLPSPALSSEHTFETRSRVRLAAWLNSRSEQQQVLAKWIVWTPSFSSFFCASGPVAASLRTARSTAPLILPLILISLMDAIKGFWGFGEIGRAHV